MILTYYEKIQPEDIEEWVLMPFRAFDDSDQASTNRFPLISNKRES